MKSIMLAIPLVFIASLSFAGLDPLPTTTKTNPTLFLGLSWTFGHGASSAGVSGITLKALSTNRSNTGALVAGVTYNFDQTIGCDFGVAYNGNGNETLSMSYDLCRHAPQISVGASARATKGIVKSPPPR